MKKVHILELTAFDVVSGRGNGTNYQNIEYRHTVSKYVLRYKTATKQERKGIAKEVIGEVERKGGRFLCKKKNEYVFLEYMAMHEKIIKVMQSLRDEAKKMKHAVQFGEVTNDGNNSRSRSRGPKEAKRSSKHDTTTIQHNLANGNNCFMANVQAIEQNSTRLQGGRNSSETEHHRIHVIPTEPQDDDHNAFENQRTLESNAIEVLCCGLRVSRRFAQCSQA
eukprot:CAMPEP_0118681626 /NCGR_PEP_ID=MMETSP0800-20121206/5045_1 /TAXON_ID=210618 ORGANISM="Striatella unipunctata, Strain CCMP2910" /NCGR_SAMPLE_ID=MMETSP0800 /ASSEMBLY_ACC=CAM_ASM_000638 /LENGTH=221 /DNA_ID=CAMNT_0006577947 /DNA_START=1 /DNA_END=666 /DNA_ORIENTATION=+